MDVVTTVRTCLETWSKGGEGECRNILVLPHCNLSDSGSVDVLFTAYHTLLSSTMKTWGLKWQLGPRDFVNFVVSVLTRLPSSSTLTGSWLSSRDVTLFGEHLVDMIWALDVELEENLLQARTLLADEAAKKNPAMAKSLEAAKLAKDSAESDKVTLQTIIRSFLDVGILNPAFCRERLDAALLANVSLIADKTVLEKKEVRTRTALFYKQNKFNLLREQSEGYSKLTTELTSSLGPAHSTTTGRPCEAWSVIEDRARPVWERVISLIGYFDLDPNRALDIILDVLSVHLATHYTFFLALLSFSPWVAGFQRPTPETTMKIDLAPGSFKGMSLDQILSLVAKGANNVVQPRSNTRVLAQVLGFKLAYYHSPGVTQVTPHNLYLTAAILIREGFISLEDLYPHILPIDEEMEQTHKAYLENIEARMAGARVSQLAMAAPLESSTSNRTKATPTVEVKKQPEIKEQSNNQKIGLLHALLSVGAIKPALSILTKFPWLVDSNPEIADLIIRTLKVSIGSLYDSMMNKERNPSFIQPKTRYGPSGLLPTPVKKQILTLSAPTPPSTITTDFVFFFPDWADQIPICTSLDDMIDVVEPLLRFIGLRVSRDPLFLTKILRLGRMHLQTTIPIDPETKKQVSEPETDNPIRIFWFNFTRHYLLPAIPLIQGNAVVTVDIWNIIRQYDVTLRWRLYGEWKSHVYDSHPELRVREVQADRESKGLLRRLSLNTIETISASVGKLAHSNPCILFRNAVNQVMAYDNLSNVVIQALRYVTTMGFDVLVFMSLDALANPHKARVKEDGVNISDWLQSLSAFIGQLFRRYSADLTSTLKYIAHQLYNNQLTEIVVLRELIWKMAGIEPLPNLNDSQIRAMAGGPILRVEAVASAARGARVDPSDVLKGPQRLGRALLDSGLALPLLIQVAKQRQACIYDPSNASAHLKSLANLFDTTHGVLLQYLELLTSSNVIPLEDYQIKVLPPLADLAEKYGICAPICMQIIRPVLHAAILKSALEAYGTEDKALMESLEAEKRLKATLTAKRESSTSRVASPVVSNLSPADEIKGNGINAADVEMEVDSTPVVTSGPWQPVLATLFEDVKKVAPPAAIDLLGPGFYLTFWQMSTFDLSPPSTKYDEESATLRTLSEQEDAKFRAADRSTDRVKRLTASSHRTKRDRYRMYIDLLNKEAKDHLAARQYTLKRLAREKSHWFAHTSARSGLLISAIVEHCIQPRCLLSPMDADFCAQFIKVMHLQGTPLFLTSMCYDKLLGDHVKVVLFSCSEYEARNYGRFLLGVLTDLKIWYQSQSLYEQDNNTKVGPLPGMQLSLKKGGVYEPWTSFKTLVNKWYKKLVKSFIDCIHTGEFMHVYNTFIVLKEILPVFPTDRGISYGTHLDRAIDAFLEHEERGDLKILGRAYSASLKKRESSFKTQQPSSSSSTLQAPQIPPTGPAAAQADRPRSAAPPSAPTTSHAAPHAHAHHLPHPPHEPRRTQSNTPLAPRAQLLNTNTVPTQPAERNTLPPSSKFSMDSVPRPEVVRRVRADVKNGDSPKAHEGTLAEVHKVSTQTETRAKEDVVMMDRSNTQPTQRYSSPNVGPDQMRNHMRDSLHPASQFQSNSTVGDKPNSPRPRPQDERPRGEPGPSMPPPSAPSQKASAQELRETAKQTISRTDKPDDKLSRIITEVRAQNGSAAPSPRVRSPSPTSRPGTRNHSNDSRASGGRPRSDRGNVDSGAEDRRIEKDRIDSREHGPAPLGRRDSISHPRPRSGRDRQSAREEKDDKKDDRDRDRDRDRRDRHGDRDRDKDRDRERDRERERERDRERDKDRDRHRRDEKDRDRESRKDRETGRGAIQSTSMPQDDRGLPTRPDPSRHRSGPGSEDSLGKRRRGTDDEPERGSKRSSRKEGHRDDRNRRPGDKDIHDRGRDSDRHKDRDTNEDSSRAAVPEKSTSSDKRPLETSNGSKVLPISTPSAPRAMASADRNKSDSGAGRDRHRDHHTSSNTSSGGPSNSNAPHDPASISGVSSSTSGNGNLGGGTNANHPSPGPSSGGGSLRSRIMGDKEPPRSQGQPSSSNSYRTNSPRKDDDRDSRKRTASEREKEPNDNTPPSGSGIELQPLKRPRIIRNRYPSSQTPHGGQSPHSMPRKSLNDLGSNDKPRARKD